MKKKAKRYQGGGLAGIAQTAQDLMGQVDNAANTIKTGGGSGSPTGVGFTAQPVPDTQIMTHDLRPINHAVFFGGIPESRFTNLGAGGLKGTLGYKKGGQVKSASKRADGCAQRGKTRGKIV